MKCVSIFWVFKYSKISVVMALFISPFKSTCPRFCALKAVASSLKRTITSFTLSGFATDRFNSQNDNYDVIGNWANNGYTLISASIYTGSVTLATIGVGSSLSTNLTTSGSQSYRLAVTSSNPLDGSTAIITTTVPGTLNKSRPNVPILTITGNTVQLGIDMDPTLPPM